jgi:putative intracellular protease/amidase
MYTDNVRESGVGLAAGGRAREARDFEGGVCGGVCGGVARVVSAGGTFDERRCVYVEDICRAVVSGDGVHQGTRRQ